jgi:hypothetical protein
MPMPAIAHLAARYLRLERERERLAAMVDGSSLPEHERVAAVLRSAGILSTLGDD